MTQAESVFITGRRNFLVRALGFTAAAAPVPFLTATKAPVITPELIEAMRGWKASYIEYEASLASFIEFQKRCNHVSQLPEYEERRLAHDGTSDRMWDIRHQLDELICKTV